jgi:hypothetical protein
MKKAIFKHWITTLAGVAIVAIKLLISKGNITPDDLPALAAGLGLIAASDGNKEQH